MSNLPRNLIKYLSLQILAELTSREISHHSVRLGFREDNRYQEETFPVVEYLIDKYIPNKIVSHVIETVPETLIYQSFLTIQITKIRGAC